MTDQNKSGIFKPKFLLFNLLLTGLVAFLLQSYVVIPFGESYGLSKTVQILIIVGYFIITVPLALLASQRFTRHEPLDKVLAYAAYEDFKEFLDRIKGEQDSVKKVEILNNMSDLIDKMPEQKREWARNTAGKLKKDLGKS